MLDSSMICSIVGVHNPTVSVVQSTALLENDRHTNIHSHADNNKFFKII
jgi:hypothetical protein